MPVLPLEVTLFKTLHAMNEVRPFKLAFLVKAPHSPKAKDRQELAEALNSVTEKGFFDFLDFPPTIRFIERRDRDVLL